jgi:hypothetical protein
VRRVKLIIGAVLLLGVPVTLAAGQSSVPTVAVSVSGSNVVLDPSGPIGAGPTRFTFEGQNEFNLATLRAGVSLDQLRQSLSNPRSVKALSQVFLEATVTPGKAVTVDLRPNTTYVGVVIADRRQAFTTFTTGGPNGASAPRPDARIRMVDYGFRGPTETLPRSGRIRVENAGTTLHFAIAFRLRRGVTSRQVNRAFRGTNERALGRVVAGEPVDVQGLISQGSTNDNEVSFGRRGRYAMVCFFSEHNRLGMFRVYRVR